MSERAVLTSISPINIIRGGNADLYSIETVASSPITLSDGYHTMDELYDHRMILFVTLFNALLVKDADSPCWKSKFHGDGSPMFDGMFIAGIGYASGRQITYHLDLKYWDLCGNDLDILHQESIPPYDGHTSKDVLERLNVLCQELLLSVG